MNSTTFPLHTFSTLAQWYHTNVMPNGKKAGRGARGAAKKKTTTAKKEEAVAKPKPAVYVPRKR